MVTSEWEPFFASTLKNQGVLIEIAKTAFMRKGHSAKIQWYPWKRCMYLTAKGKKDIAIGYFSKERAKTYLYSKPFFEVDIGLVALKETNLSSYKSLKDLKPYVIGVNKGWVNSSEFDSATYLNKDYSLLHHTTIRKLFGKRIDMIVTSIPVFRYEVNKMNKYSLSDVVILKPLLSKNGLYLFSSFNVKDHRQIIQDFNEGLTEIQQDGTYEKIFIEHGF
ncbi:substrate-binding periplasmic protein [Spartinivicinus ruber]|uniref:substrate-binding periplasmic protein n=1 Tax=Spartinivicinus ruber TaxID=2683272 RepID=UPI0013D4C2FD|nr:transporter substrate-binding domain-containing protein [Spartinivicinus ruber]